MRFGSINLRTGGMSQTSRQITNHPNFHEVLLNNDISVIRIPTPLSLGHGIRAVLLPRRVQQSELFNGKLGTVSGWGATTNEGPAQSVLRWTNVRIISNDQCRRSFSPLVVVGHVVCTTGTTGNQGVCGGDSGGPLVLNENGITTQIGVVAFGAHPRDGGCTAGRPSGYMRTTSFLTWINQRTGITIRN